MSFVKEELKNYHNSWDWDEYIENEFILRQKHILKTYEEHLEDVRKDCWDIIYVPEELRSDEMVLEALSKDQDIYCYIANPSQTIQDYYNLLNL